MLQYTCGTVQDKQCEYGGYQLSFFPLGFGALSWTSSAWSELLYARKAL